MQHTQKKITQTWNINIREFVDTSAFARPHKGCTTIPDFALFTGLLYVFIPASASMVSQIM